jgi:addiction module HigA family antidote
MNKPIETIEIPPHPGEVIRESCIVPSGMSITRVAKALGVSRNSVSELLNGHHGISAEMAIRLSMAFGSEPEVWLKKQLDYDLWNARQRVAEKALFVERIVS